MSVSGYVKVFKQLYQTIKDSNLSLVIQNIELKIIEIDTRLEDLERRAKGTI